MGDVFPYHWPEGILGYLFLYFGQPHISIQHVNALVSVVSACMLLALAADTLAFHPQDISWEEPLYAAV